MLEERSIKPDRRGRKRRCFRGDWLEALLTCDGKGAVSALFVTYLAPYRGVFVLEWSPQEGHRHHRLGYDSGGAETITCPDAQYLGGGAEDGLDREELHNRILVGAALLERKVRDFLMKTIKSYPHELKRCGFCKEARPADCRCGCGARACIPCVKKDAFLASPCLERTLHSWSGVPD